MGDSIMLLVMAVESHFTSGRITRAHTPNAILLHDLTLRNLTAYFYLSRVGGSYRKLFRIARVKSMGIWEVRVRVIHKLFVIWAATLSV